ncbi:hypothetical protein AOQ84DRAFT_371341 [Glonium stellatum]|uniref:Uncharacterized protein n=1 Tax=Glonium stellatum TaxID=574774 RepID=A0A8E2JYJ1_9PEZI|nr:hypothetical protein AOQ84DRAFT_371341 [Glonium stellatum]
MEPHTEYAMGLMVLALIAYICSVVMLRLSFLAITFVFIYEAQRVYFIGAGHAVHPVARLLSTIEMMFYVLAPLTSLGLAMYWDIRVFRVSVRKVVGNAVYEFGNSFLTIFNPHRKLTKGLKSKILALERTLRKTQTNLQNNKAALDLSQINVEDTQAALNKAQSELRNVRADLSRNQIELENTHAALSRKEADLKNIKAALTSAQDFLQSTRAALKSSQTDLQNTKFALEAAQIASRNSDDNIQNINAELKKSREECVQLKLDLEVAKSGQVLVATQSLDAQQNTDTNVAANAQVVTEGVPVTIPLGSNEGILSLVVPEKDGREMEMTVQPMRRLPLEPTPATLRVISTKGQKALKARLVQLAANHAVKTKNLRKRLVRNQTPSLVDWPMQPTLNPISVPNTTSVVLSNHPIALVSYNPPLMNLDSFLLPHKRLFKAHDASMPNRSYRLLDWYKYMERISFLRHDRLRLRLNETRIVISVSPSAVPTGSNTDQDHGNEASNHSAVVCTASNISSSGNDAPLPGGDKPSPPGALIPEATGKVASSQFLLFTMLKESEELCFDAMEVARSSVKRPLDNMSMPPAVKHFHKSTKEAHLSLDNLPQPGQLLSGSTRDRIAAFETTVTGLQSALQTPDLWNELNGTASCSVHIWIYDIEAGMELLNKEEHLLQEAPDLLRKASEVYTNLLLSMLFQVAPVSSPMQWRFDMSLKAAEKLSREAFVRRPPDFLHDEDFLGGVNPLLSFTDTFAGRTSYIKTITYIKESLGLLLPASPEQGPSLDEFGELEGGMKSRLTHACFRARHLLEAYKFIELYVPDACLPATALNGDELTEDQRLMRDQLLRTHAKALIGDGVDQLLRNLAALQKISELTSREQEMMDLLADRLHRIDCLYDKGADPNDPQNGVSCGKAQWEE